MDSNNFKDDELAFTQSNIERLKLKYSQEMKDDPDNPLKVSMRLIFSSASERDPKKRSSMAEELSEFLTKPDGVMNLFLALIDFDPSSQKVTTHNQRFVAVSNIISHLPKLCMPYETYCVNITKQIKTLLINDDPKYSQLASIIYKSMLESPHAKNKSIERIIIDPIVEGVSSSNASYSAKESILAINSLISNHMSPLIFVEKTNAFHQLFYALVCLSKTPSRLKIPLKSTLVSILDALDCGAACCLLEETLFHSKETHTRFSTKLEDDEISIGVVAQNLDETSAVSLKAIENVTLSLIESSKKDLLVLEFFFHFKDIMITSRDDTSREMSTSMIEQLLKHSIEEQSTKLDLLSIVANNSHRSLELILRTLLNYVASLRMNSADIGSTFDSIRQSMSSCISILEVLSAITNSEEDQDLIKSKCLPVLKQVQELLYQCNPNFSKEELAHSLKSLIEKLELNLDAVKQTTKSSNDNSLFIEGEFKSIMKDLNDKLVPVRVHALVRIKQLVMANNLHAVSRIPQLYELVEASMAESEPYVFLACINLIAEMALRRTNEILPKLIVLYRRNDLNLQHRINIGEVLVRLTKQLNATTPHYAQQVMNALFIGCKDEEELVRMSNLVNIGQICHSLGDSLGNYMIDLLAQVEATIQSDTLQVKCAAVELLRTALSGLNRLRVESIQKDLKRVYGLLKKLRFSSFEDKLCVQVDLALDEIDRIAKDLLNLDIGSKQQTSLEKSIQVLSLLDR